MKHLIFGLVLLLLSASASAQDKPGFVGADRALRNTIIGQVQNAWSDSDFDTLERIAEEFTGKRAKTFTGKWRLSVYIHALEPAFRINWPSAYDDTRCDCKIPAPAHYSKAEALWGAQGAKADAWIAKYPKSAHALVAKAAYLMRRGWFYRGGGYAQTVPPEAWPMFNGNIAKARTLLESTRAVSSASPLWYELMLKIANAQSWPASEHAALVKDFLANGQDYPDSYLAVFVSLQPKWGGSVEAMESFARYAAKRTSPEEGAGLYTRLYWNVYPSFGNDLFTETRADWGTMRQGFQDIVSRYPDSWNLNAFAMFSCLAKDFKTAASVLKKVGEEVDQNFWRAVSLPACKAASGAAS